MIDSIHIKNFQCHKNLKIDFSDITAIIGLSQSGKTAIQRAVQLLITKKPGIQEYFPDNLKEGNVEIEVNVENKILGLCQKVKIQKDNQPKIIDEWYYLNDQKFRVLNRKVPEEILNILGFSEYVFGTVDEVFLAKSSAGEIGRYFNSVLRLDKALEWISKLKKRINSKQKELEIRKNDLISINNELKKYSKFNIIEAFFKKYERLKDNQKQQKEKLQLLSQYQKKQNEIKRFENLDRVMNLLSQVEKINNDQKQEKEKIEFLNKYRERFERYQILEKTNQLKDSLLDLKDTKDRLSFFRKVKTLLLDLNALNRKLDVQMKIFEKEKKKQKFCPICEGKF